MAGLEVETIVAPNPGPMTLEGTNTYLVGRDPVTVIDPGPEDAGHIEAVRTAAEERGGIGTVLVTHSHGDHVGGVEMLGVEPGRPADGEVVALSQETRRAMEHDGWQRLLVTHHGEDSAVLAFEKDGRSALFAFDRNQPAQPSEDPGVIVSLQLQDGTARL